MTTNMNALALRDAPCNAMDIESQRPEAPQYNRNLARAKIATLAVAGLAGTFTTALIALHERSDPVLEHDGRSLLKNDCSPHHLDKISKTKQALVISGATAGACFGGTILGGCLMSICSETEENNRSFGGLLREISALGFGLSATATMISGIMYGKAKGKC